MRHYAPRALLIPLEMEAKLETGWQAQWLQAIIERSRQTSKIGIMLPAGWPLPKPFSGVHYVWGSWDNDRELAQRLFAGLRSLDAMEAELILCPLPSAFGMGAAIRDRLLKAARRE